MMRTLLGLAGLIACTAAGTSPISADTMAGVRGQVVDGTTNAPLRALVTIEDQAGRTLQVPTDRKGGFVAIGLEPGSVTVSLEAVGFVQQAVTCYVPAGETGRFDLRGFRSVGEIENEARHHAGYRCKLEPQTEDHYLIL